ncbi:uncharacterized protein LOC107847707 isoform X2 [Capsicum annuum]|uniref:uncharacterized protein LOC107847707 isoform X2 n=1 Tax=Capsicum annuum TaxID=4072 RepID=UPI001FB19729|nr:uncharacterized protein LOC107847707 isoform X2 [Capsicum annuum]
MTNPSSPFSDLWLFDFLIVIIICYHQPVYADTIWIRSKLFTRCQVRKLQRIQRLFIKQEVLEEVFLPSRGCHLMMIAISLDQGSSEEARSPSGGTCVQGALDLLWTCSSISRAVQNSPYYT